MSNPRQLDLGTSSPFSRLWTTGKSMVFCTLFFHKILLMLWNVLDLVKGTIDRYRKN